MAMANESDEATVGCSRSVRRGTEGGTNGTDKRLIWPDRSTGRRAKSFAARVTGLRWVAKIVAEPSSLKLCHAARKGGSNGSRFDQNSARLLFSVALFWRGLHLCHADCRGGFAADVVYWVNWAVEGMDSPLAGAGVSGCSAELYGCSQLTTYSCRHFPQRYRPCIGHIA
jgi:hypothetical protein